MATGVNGDLLERQELVPMMRERTEEQKVEKERLKEIIKTREKKKLEASERLVAKATAFAPYVLDKSDEEGFKSDEAPFRKRVKKLSGIVKRSTTKRTASRRL